MDTFESFLDRTIALFRNRGIAVIVVGQIPHLAEYSLPCFAEAARTQAYEGECATPRSVVEKALAISQAKFASAAAADSGVKFISMVDLLCSGAWCTGFKDGVFLYRDIGHLNAVGSRLLADYVAPLLTRPVMVGRP